MASPNALLEELYPILDANLKNNKRALQEFEQAVGRYLDHNLDKLSTAGPIYRTLFKESDKEVMFKLTGINPDNTKAAIAKSNFIKGQWKNICSPFNVATALLITWAKRNKEEKTCECAVMYLTLSMYPSLHYKYFPFEPDPRIMDYTIANLSNKFKIKQLGTMWATLLDTAQVCDKTYTKNIVNCSDREVTNYIEAFKTRFNALLKKLKNEYMKNAKDKNMYDTEKDNQDPENFATSDSNSFRIERITNSVSMRLAINGPNTKVVAIAAKMSEISQDDLRTTTTSLLSDNENAKDVKIMLSSILYLFLSDEKNSIMDIRSTKFLTTCMMIYKRSNTMDKNIVMIKKLLEKWLNKYSERYTKSNRLATLNNFRKGLFTFFVLSIQLNVS